ncbi:MAG: hypothetical protein J7K87_03340 [Candidatus Aenigmarchaeota archaeon]|nr:hypothetical protein [Candidatus Aenigmarchaeota archaeon]
MNKTVAVILALIVFLILFMFVFAVYSGVKGYGLSLKNAGCWIYCNFKIAGPLRTWLLPGGPCGC